MEENFLYPMLLSAVVAIASSLARDRTRASLERRVAFYAAEEDRYPSGRFQEFVRTVRIRVVARLIALDHVRQTAALPAGAFMILSGWYLFIGVRDFSLNEISSLGWPAIGVICALVAGHSVVALIGCFDARRGVIKDVLHGSAPSGSLLNPLEDAAAYQHRWRAAAVYVGNIAAPSALGFAAGAWRAHELAAALLLVVGVGAYAGLGWGLVSTWRNMDQAASNTDVSEAALERFRVVAPSSASH